ncbi:zinc-dependent metalloprotease family protein [Nocardioides bruguierae]|uniref:Fibronectin type-III domain-containing protein n=1 Tax=Nocardioides bruguierae TaxID=2945102 RepID=A0A9X2D934_9ACTN|nr:zinc-dependent metalloprotease family protein [Nocardioides bruguierae]MCM0621552.1 hypothetical protein [Nocardioides bruguierae]
MPVPFPPRLVAGLAAAALAAPLGVLGTGPSSAEPASDPLAAVAARAGLSVAATHEVLAEDETATVRDGRLVYTEPAAPVAARTTADATSARVAPLESTFALHSNPGAALTILLDVDGTTAAEQVIGSAWSLTVQGAHPAWDPAGDGPAFSDAELARVQEVWARVAEDFAAFDVDVTTEDPGTDALVRTDTADTRYGTRVLITPSVGAYAELCTRGCGGLAFVGTFAATGGRHQPAWVFPQGTGGSAKSVAEAASHEAGHNLGLTHDGDTTSSYSRGQGVWAPIMGVGYYRPLTQWSRGDYPGATNTQDDLAILVGRLGLRADEAPSLPADATPVFSTGGLTTDGLTTDGGGAVVAAGVIGTSDDVDAWALGTCAAGAQVRVAAPSDGTDLDVRARLVRSTDPGSPLVTAAPTATAARGVVEGLDATLSVPEAGEAWVLLVDGVGEGSWSDGGYDDYASLGSYEVSVTGCGDALRPARPGRPRVRVRADGSVVVAWRGAGDTGAPVLAYRLGGTAERTRASPDVRRVVLAAPAPGTHRVRVVAIGEHGTTAGRWRRYQTG